MKYNAQCTAEEQQLREENQELAERATLAEAELSSMKPARLMHLKRVMQTVVHKEQNRDLFSTVLWAEVEL